MGGCSFVFTKKKSRRIIRTSFSFLEKEISARIMKCVSVSNWHIVKSTEDKCQGRLTFPGWFKKNMFCAFRFCCPFWVRIRFRALISRHVTLSFFFSFLSVMPKRNANFAQIFALLERTGHKTKTKVTWLLFNFSVLVRYRVTLMVCSP